MAGMVLGLVDRFSSRSTLSGGWSDGVLVGVARLVRLWLGRCCVAGFAVILAVVNGIGWGIVVWGVWVAAGFLEQRHVSQLQRAGIRARLSGGRSHTDADSDAGSRATDSATGWADLAGSGLGGRGAGGSSGGGVVGALSGGACDRELG